MSSRKRTYLKLVLVGNSMVGKSTLCREWGPEFAPEDGYHVYHSHNIIDVKVSDTGTPPLPKPPANDSQHDHKADSFAEVSLHIMILQPRQEPEFSHVRLTPFVMMNTDVVGLCYNPLDVTTLESAVHKWFPFIKHYLPLTPIILIGHSDSSFWWRDQRDKGILATTSEQRKRAMNQTGAVDSVQWSRETDEGMVTPQHIAQVLAWYGYRYAGESARANERGCITM